MITENDLAELDDILGSLLNRILIAKHLIKFAGHQPEVRFWLATLLEDNFQNMQTIIDTYCIIGEKEDNGGH